jgi:hypothetical protein
MGWVSAEMAGRGENGPRQFFQLNKSARRDKIEEILETSEKVKFGMELDLNIFHNFCIRHFDQRSTMFK